MSARSFDVHQARSTVRSAATRTRCAAVGQPPEVRAQLLAVVEALDAAEAALTRALCTVREVVRARRPEVRS